MIDLRSDTVTQPTPEMRAAMAAAEVGDDVYGEDPTLNALQEEAAAAVGKEAALFVPSGTMGNLLAVKCHTQPGDEVLLDRNAHIVQFEMGGMAWFSGVLPQTLDSRRGLLDPSEVAAHIKRNGPYYRACTGLICVENSHNFGGGAVYPLETLAEIHAVARARGVPVHMDGARIFNAAVCLGVPAAEIARYADTVMFCFSKGLSAPVGSIVCGSAAFIEQARRVRRVVGGGMRQAGVLAAAARVALRTMVSRLAEDHATAQLLARGLADVPGIRVDPSEVQTNILMFRMEGGAATCTALVTALREQGILVSQLASDTIRMVTHRHITSREVERVMTAVRRCPLR